MSTNDPEQIRADIERTRTNLSYDVNALADQANPKNVAQRQVDKVKGGIGDLKDRIMGSDDDDLYGYRQDPTLGERAGQRADDARQVVSDAPRQLRQKTRGNPLAAGLIAFGLGALVGGLIPATDQERRAALAVKEKAEPLAEEAQAIAKDAAEHLRPQAEEAVEHVKQSATDSVDHVKGEAQVARDDVQYQAETSRDHIQQARDN